MKPTSFIFSLSFILFVLLSCDKGQEAPPAIRPALLAVEAIVDSLPEEACRRLSADTFNMDHANEAERMKYALLKCKAEDKLLQAHTNDSVMKTVLEYYKAHGTQEEQMEAHYQLGGIYRDIHDAPQAVDHYTQAMMIGEEHPQETRRETLMRVYSQLAWILRKQGDIRQELEIARKKSRLYDDKDYYSLQELGTAYKHNGQYDSACHYLRAACTAVDRLQPPDTAEMLATYGLTLAQGIKMKDSAMVRKCYERLRHFPHNALPELALTGLYFYFEGVDDDSLRIFLEEAYEKDDMVEKRMMRATRLSHYYYRKGNLEKAMRYALARDSLYEIYSKDLELQQSSNAYNQYIYNRDKQKEQEIKDAKALAEKHFYIILIISLSGLLITMLFVLFFKHIYNTQKARADQLTTDKDELQEELRQHIAQKQRIDGEQLRAQLHLMAKKPPKEAIITPELQDKVITFVTVEWPDFSSGSAVSKSTLKISDLMMLYLRKIGMNQTETARLLGCTRSTVCRRLTALDTGTEDEEAE